MDMLKAILVTILVMGVLVLVVFVVIRSALRADEKFAKRQWERDGKVWSVAEEKKVDSDVVEFDGLKYKTKFEQMKEQAEKVGYSEEESMVKRPVYVVINVPLSDRRMLSDFLHGVFPKGLFEQGVIPIDMGGYFVIGNSEACIGPKTMAGTMIINENDIKGWPVSKYEDLPKDSDLIHLSVTRGNKKRLENAMRQIGYVVA